MADTDTAESALEAAAGAAGPHATEAFALLGDETRLAILLALWERYDPHADDTHGSPAAVPFSELFERVNYDNPGNFSYHLEQLDGQFIRQRGEREGYELRMPGLKLVQAIIAGAGLEDVTLDAAEIDQACPFCDAPTEISYREGLVFQACTKCDGAVPERTNTDGFLNAVKFHPAGLADRTPEELRAASRVASLRQIQSMFNGLCPTCSGPVDAWLDCCTNHDSDGICEHCGTPFDAWARFRCRICKDHGNASPKELAMFHPAVISFYDDHGVSIRFCADDFESVTRGFDLMDAHEMNLTSTDPLQVTVTITYEGDDLGLTFDETVTVVDVQR